MFWLLFILAALGGVEEAAAKDQPVAITFGLMADGKEVGCGAPLANLGGGHLQAKLREARFYVYDVKLVDAKRTRTPVALTQNEWQYGDVALLDFKDPRGGNALARREIPQRTQQFPERRRGALMSASNSLSARLSRRLSTASPSLSTIPTSRPCRRLSISPVWPGIGRRAADF
jgi:hypothetical protein